MLDKCEGNEFCEMVRVYFDSRKLDAVFSSGGFAVLPFLCFREGGSSQAQIKPGMLAFPLEGSRSSDLAIAFTLTLVEVGRFKKVVVFRKGYMVPRAVRDGVEAVW